MKFLFIDVPEVEIKVGHRGLPSIAQGHDILYDRGTERRRQTEGKERVEEGQTRGYFFQTPLQSRGDQESMQGTG